MDYEKKYKEALERTRKLKENPQSVFNEYSPKEGDTICDYIFPELKESEDEKIRKELIDFFQDWHKIKPSRLSVNVSDILAWLEKQGEQKLAEWSEEDESLRLRTIGALETCKIGYPTKCVDEQINWLKSLKDRYTWKPSDKQMKALHDLNLTGNISYGGQGQILIELYNDLKKLIE